MKLNPYLNFDGTCREAMEFYQTCIGGEIEAAITYGDMPAPEPSDNPAGCAEGMDMSACAHLMAHMRLVAGDLVLMASDCPPGMFEAAAGTACSLQVDDPADAKRVFDALSAGGMVFMPFGPTDWAEAFGMFKDKFGIPWMVNCEGNKANAFN
jgi:PhnB protein